MLFKRLNEASTSPQHLESFLQTNIQLLYDFYNGDFAEILNQREEINTFILTKRIGVYERLDFTKSDNKALVIILLDFCSRLGFVSAIQLENVIRRHNIDVGLRLDAARDFLLAPNAKALIERFESICQKLQASLTEEEELEKKVLVTFANYYAKIIREASTRFINDFIEKVKKLRITSENYFLQHAFVDSLLKVNPYNCDDSFLEIQRVIQTFLGTPLKKISGKPAFEIEHSTDYALLLNYTSVTFNNVWQISSDKMSQYTADKKTAIHRDILRGVKVLDKESELYGYLYFYGKMHNQKLVDALSCLPLNFEAENIEVIDWGCGQGIGSVAFFDFFSVNLDRTVIQSVTLIEPSEIALKRASLHVKKMDGHVKISTIRSDFDSLDSNDLKSDGQSVKFHIFSNVLDVDLFSLSELLKTIETSFSGTNYFICVSPFINDMRTARIDAFMNFFSRYPSLKILQNINNRKGEWMNGWSRVARVFCVTI
jgi:hypothetical protein